MPAASDFSVRETPVTPCAGCGLPVRAAGPSAERFCSASCRVSRRVFGGDGAPPPYGRLAAGCAAAALTLGATLAVRTGLVDRDGALCLLWLQGALFLPAFWAFGLPQWQGGEESPGLRLEALVTAACLGAAGFSALRLAQDVPVAFFDSATLVLTLAALGALLETAARAQGARALGPLLDPVPDKVAVVRDGGERASTTAAVRPGDRFRVAAGEPVALDAVVVEGRAVLSALRLSGSGEPLTGGPGLEVPSGAVNLGEPLLLEATRPGASASWLLLRRELHELLLARRNSGAGVAALLTQGPLLLFAAAVLVFLAAALRVAVDAAWARSLALLAAAAPGAYLAASELALAFTARNLARLGVSCASPAALREAAELPAGLAETLPAGRTRLLRAFRQGDGSAGPTGPALREAVVLCRRFEYNIRSRAWFLLAWTGAGTLLAATGVLLPPMAAGFALLGALFQTSRALTLSKTI